MVEITPEVQAQLDEQKKQCIFCKIVSGEQESKGVYKDHLMHGVLDINPGVKGHMLLMPQEHYPIMPYLPPETFSHLFGMLPLMITHVKKAMLMTGATVFVANGAAAGQQAPHFLIHLLPREKGDKINKFAFDKPGSVDQAQAQQVHKMFEHNLPLMMRNHFQRNPATWRTGQVKRGEHITATQVLYEDEKALVAVPENPQVLGHLVVYSQESPDFDTLDKESAAHLFFVASFCATAVFEGLKAHGTNLILKTGVSGDNPDGKLALHVLPRYQDDGLDVQWDALDPKPELDDIASKIKDQMFYVEHSLKKKPEKKVVHIESEEIGEVKKDEESDKESSAEDEIRNAIKNLKRIP